MPHKLVSEYWQWVTRSNSQGEGSLQVTVTPPEASPSTEAKQDEEITALNAVADSLGVDGSTPPAFINSSSGVRGWLHSIFTKLPTLASVGAPSAEVTTVAGPQNQGILQVLNTIGVDPNPAVTGSITLNCEGMSEAVFFVSAVTSPVMTIRMELNFGLGFFFTEFLTHPASSAVAVLNYNPVTPAVNTWHRIGLKGAKQVRLRVITYTSGSATVMGACGLVPTWPVGAVEVLQGTLTGVTTVSTVSSVTAVSSLTALGTNCISTEYADTSTNLAANATFTGTTRVSTAGNKGFFYADFFSDVGSAVGGCIVEKSINGTTWILADPPVTLSAGVPARIKVPITAVNYRVRYINGASPQTIFSITSSQKLSA